MYKGFLGSNGIRNQYTQPLDCHPIARNTNKNNPISASMRSIVFLGLAALVCGGENSQHPLLVPSHKRSLLMTFPSHGSSSYSVPISSSMNSGYNLGGSSGGFSLGHAGLNLGGHGIGYSLPSASGLGSGYLSSGSGHSSLSLQGISLHGPTAQSTYSSPSVTNIGLGTGGGSNLVPSLTKTGPVTFGSQSNAASTSGSYSSAPVYVSATQGYSGYNNGGSSVNLPSVMMGSSHGFSSYSLPIQSISSSPYHTVTGGLIIASPGSHDGSSSYSLPASGSSHGISALSSSSGSHGAAPTYSLPVTSGSHEISALSSSSSSSSYPVPVSYGSSNSHAGFSSSSSDSSNYEPISSGSYSSESSGSSYVNYLPSHSSSSSSSYSSPNIIYGSPSSSSSSYSGSGSGYSAHSSSPSHSYSNQSPIVTYSGASSYTPVYLSSSGSYGSTGSTGSQAAYSSVNPRYSRLVTVKSHDTGKLGKGYDTISYSTPNGKY
ncbi:LOW QUALITY PROTEIN: uncharacterized protein [Anoplolepis gracilipes]|uniref:LOW QUALITY PROTEIN: uncharacterized protein n=1 Tax=Anoplolepis gracilipes TaxID=354296 RepID=UPI003BA07909